MLRAASPLASCMPSRTNPHSERIVAWMTVIAVHAGLLWILVLVPREPQAVRGHEVRTRLAILPARPDAPPLLHTPSVRPQAQATSASDMPPSSARYLPSAAAPPRQDQATPGRVPVDWSERARDWVQAQETGPAPGAADPLRIGRSAALQDVRAEAFRTSEPVSVHRVLQGIGELFGGSPPSPCQTATANIPGLLTATSARERELLQEELRRQRRYCSR